MDYGAYLRSLQRYFVISTLLFFGTAIMGFTVAEQNPSIAEEWLKELEMLKWITDLPPPMIAIMIFAKNLIACAMAIFPWSSFWRGAAARRYLQWHPRGHSLVSYHPEGELIVSDGWHPAAWDNRASHGADVHSNRPSIGPSISHHDSDRRR